MPYIFAYGSNMNSEQMQDRCPSSYKIQNHILHDYQFTLPRYAEDYGGGVAGIIPNKGHDVEGVIYFLSDEDLKRLDGFECVEKGEYTREQIGRIAINGEKIAVEAHIACIQDGYPFDPPQFYADKILTGARENGLSEGYIQQVLSPILEKTA